LINQKGLEFLKRGGFKFREPFVVCGEWMILIEVAGAKSLSLKTSFENILFEQMNRNLIIDAVIASSEAQAKELW